MVQLWWGCGIVCHPRRCREAADSVAVGATGGWATAAGTAGSAEATNTGAGSDDGGETAGKPVW